MTAVELAVNGRRFDAWTRVQIDSDVLTPADAFQFELRRSESQASAWAQVLAAVRPGLPCTVHVEGSLQMTGVVDEVVVDASAEGTTLHVTGRDRAGALVDWDAPLHLAWTDVSLEAFVSDLVRPFGIATVRASNVANRAVLTGRVRGVVTESAPEDFTRLSVHQARAEADTTVWELIDRHARRFGLLPWMAVDGSLVLAAPDYLQVPRRTLKRRFDGAGNNILPGAQYRVSIAEIPSELAVHFNSGGRHEERVRGANTFASPYRLPDGTDPLASVYHPRVLRDHDVKSRAQAVHRAHVEFAKAGASWRSYSCSVRGVAQGGELWATDTTVRLEDDVAGLRETWYVHGRTFTVSREGTATELRLSPLGAIVP